MIPLSLILFAVFFMTSTAMSADEPIAPKPPVSQLNTLICDTFINSLYTYLNADYDKINMKKNQITEILSQTRQAKTTTTSEANSEANSFEKIHKLKIIE